jgi:nucleotide-binding universal stress UspA family protein
MRTSITSVTGQTGGKGEIFMFKNVLLDLGSSVDAGLIAEAVELCRKGGARLTVLNVFEEPPGVAVDYFGSQDKDLKEIILEGHRAELDEALASADAEDDSVSVEIRWGKDFIEAIRLVREREFDLLITASQASTGAPDSMAMALMRKCPCPVWIHRGNLWKGAVRILAAVNASDISDESRALNRKVLDQAIRLNEILRGHLHVVTCWSGYMESVLASPRFNEGDKAQYLEHERAQTEQELKALFDSVGLPEGAKSKIVHGNPAKGIPAYAAEQHMDVVVMGTVARTGVPGLVVGNTAERIVSALDSSVLAVKPDGFVSPVD